MPTRMLREGILDSEAVNSLSEGAELFYRRLMSVVDDYGRFDARNAVLLARLYPLKLASKTVADIEAHLFEVASAGLVAVYTAEGKQFLQLHRLGSPRAKVSKYPPPNEHTCQSKGIQTQTPPNDQNTQMNTDVNGCIPTRADVPYSYSRPYSDPYSRPTPDSGEVGRSEEVIRTSSNPEFEPDDLEDPLRTREKIRKDFEAAWNAAGLMPLTRLTRGLWTKLEGLMLDPTWRSTWRDALTRAGQSPFLASGEGSRSGPMDPSQFLRDDDFAASILRGKFDARAAPETSGRSKSQLEGDRLMAEAYRKRGLPVPPELGGA